MPHRWRRVAFVTFLVGGPCSLAGSRLRRAAPLQLLHVQGPRPQLPLAGSSRASPSSHLVPCSEAMYVPAEPVPGCGLAQLLAAATAGEAMQSSSSSSLLQLNTVPFHKGKVATLRLALSTKDGAPRAVGGQQLAGHVVVTVPDKEVVVSAARVILRCKESVVVASAFEGRHSYRWFEMSTFAQTPAESAGEELTLAAGEHQFPFELKVPCGAPPSVYSGPVDGEVHGDEKQPWLRALFGDLQGSFRVRYLLILKVPLEERLVLSREVLVAQPPPQNALREFAAWNLADAAQANVVDLHTLEALASYSRSSGGGGGGAAVAGAWTGAEEVLEKRPWMYRGGITVTASLNKRAFLLQGPADPVLLRVHVENRSSRLVKHVSAAVCVELICNGLSNDNVPISENVVQELELDGIDMANVASEVGPDSERCFTWSLQPKRTHKLPPTVDAKHFVISYSVTGTVRFNGAVLPLQFVLPFTYHRCVGDVFQVL